GVVQMKQLGFDLSAYEIWGALLNAARLVLHTGAAPDPVEIGRTIERHGVTVALFPTGLLHQMAFADIGTLEGLRLVMACGDVLSPGHAHRLATDLPDCRVVNVYGPTEATIAASWYA